MAGEQPKKPVGGAYGQFVNEKRPEFAKQCAGQKASAVSKLAGEEWKKLSDAEKAVYQSKYETAKKKFDVDMAAFLSAGGEKAKGLRAVRSEKRKKKEGKSKETDPNKPKKPVGGAYGCFLSKKRVEFQKESGGSVTAVAKLAGERWKALPEKEKAVYEEEYKQKKAAYEEAMKTYVPPVGEEVEDEEGEDAADDEPPAKKAKMDAAQTMKRPAAATAKVSKKSTATIAEPEIPPVILSKAEKAGMVGVLGKLLSFDDVKAKGITPKDALAALEGTSGLLHKAKLALLGA